MPSINGDVLPFQMSGKFADFEIRVSPYVFKTHRIVLAASSYHFGVICGSEFQESSQGFADLSDDQASITARVVEYMYTGNYSTSEISGNVPKILENAIRQQTPASPPSTALDSVTMDTPAWAVHIDVYCMADKYGMDNLKENAKQKFLVVFRSPELTIVELIKITAKVYNTPPLDESGLRKYVVHRAQLAMPEIATYPDFEELIKTEPDFAFDFATKYGARQYMWCSNCNNWITVIAGCSCGFSGICGKNEYCTALAWEELQCTGCKKKGCIHRDQPETYTTTIGKRGRAGSSGAPVAKKLKLKR